MRNAPDRAEHRRVARSDVSAVGFATTSRVAIDPCIRRGCPPLHVVGVGLIH